MDTWMEGYGPPRCVPMGQGWVRHGLEGPNGRFRVVGPRDSNTAAPVLKGEVTIGRPPGIVLFLPGCWCSNRGVSAARRPVRRQSEPRLRPNKTLQGRAAGPVQWDWVISGMFYLTGILAALFLLSTEWVRAQRCSSPCKCPEDPPECPPGVRLLPDKCGCCRVCAKQAGEVCSDSDACDPQLGLQCEHGADSPHGLGVCIARRGSICMYGGVVYQNGETFQPSCKYQCTCKDGLIGCVPRCNLDILLPSPDCPFPKQVQVPGECCEQWVCDHKQEASLRGITMTAYRQEVTYDLDLNGPGLNCIQQTTPWSVCSKTCGMGTSTRLSSYNLHCDMVKEMRLCEVRPCDYKVTAKNGKRCSPTSRAVRPTHLAFKDCLSIQPYRPRYCGVCSDGRCCAPYSTRTSQVDLKCRGGLTIKHQLMIINTCVCHDNCVPGDTIHQMEQISSP